MNIMFLLPQRQCVKFLLGIISSWQDVEEILGDISVNDKGGKQVKFGRASVHDANLTSIDRQKERRKIILEGPLNCKAVLRES